MEEIGINSTRIEAMRTGDKTIEVRLGKPRMLRIKEGDILSIREDFWYEGKVLESLPDALRVKVTQVLYFESFKELFSAIDFEAASSAKTVDEAIKNIRQFYSPEDEKEYGAVAIFFEPLV